MFQVWFTNYLTGQRVYFRIETMIALEALDNSASDGVTARTAIYVVDRAEPWKVTETVEQVVETIREFVQRSINQQRQAAMVNGVRR
jgi:hypothetical protein